MDLDRFVVAQDRVWSEVLAELHAGQKRTHWMWFVFPQLKGLGHSPTAQFYGIADASEARAYLAHPLLGPRLEDAVGTVLGSAPRNAVEIFGPVDALKFRSSMTLFAAVATERILFDDALARYYGGNPDEATLTLLNRG